MIEAESVWSRLRRVVVDRVALVLLLLVVGSLAGLYIVIRSLVDLIVRPRMGVTA